MDHSKSIAESSSGEFSIDEDFYVLRLLNDTESPELVHRYIDRSFIQFHFCLGGGAQFQFNEGSYTLQVREEHSLLLFNTQKDLPLQALLAPKSTVLSVVMTIQKFHSLFSTEAAFIPFLHTDTQEKKYYAQEIINPTLSVTLRQILNPGLHASVKDLYLKGKVYELIALYFNRVEDADLEQCPFLADEDNVQRIRMAKDVVVARMSEPPSLDELSKEVGLSLRKLKDGFKQIYGDSVYGFLFDYKMEYARKMLKTGRYNVNEVGLKVGYSTASHFIAAFKKKYGTTPKKYVTSIA